ncbi:MAG: UDP-N-acetylmuramate dehydrogenase [Clostridia bacterium]|nr:UDP-N-acetylmuramate dehydrogenase [Clostridia bacterium]
MNRNDDWSGYSDFLSERFFDFSKYSSIGCGGIAPIAFYPKNKEETLSLLARLKRDGRECLTLGNLTNVLPPDEGVDKALLFLKNLRSLTIRDELVFVEAGVTSGALLNATRQAGLSGVEFLVGIPCVLGGALFMNAGAGGRYISEAVESVTFYHEGKILQLSTKDCEYAYKSSVFMREEGAILGATLRLKKSTQSSVKENIAVWLERRAHLPKGKSMGCVFKNPQGVEVSAGKLIEGAGLKGLRVGGAVVAKAHANFIINDKHATEKEIRALIKMIKNAVFAQYKINLEEEIRYLG